MPEIINAKQLRARLKEVVAKVRHGERFTVLYRSRPAFDIVPVGSPTMGKHAARIRFTLPGPARRRIGIRET